MEPVEQAMTDRRHHDPDDDMATLSLIPGRTPMAHALTALGAAGISQLMSRPKIKPSLGTFLFVMLGVLAAAAVVPSASGQTAKRPIALDDLAKIRSVGDPQRSPDGKWVAFTVGTTDLEKDKRDTDIWMVSWDGAEEVRLTSSPDDESAPRWSPDGRYLAFLASRGTEEEKKLGAQVWLLDRRGGEAQKLTEIKGGVKESAWSEIKGGVEEYAWSPDGRRLVIVSNDQDPADEPEKMEGWKRKTTPPIVIDRYHFKEDREGYLKRLNSHLWLFDVAGRKAEPLTSGPYSDSAPVWSPDGTRIAFVSRRGPDPDRAPDSSVFVVEAKPGAEVQKLTTREGPDGGRLAWSPDGQWLAFLLGDEPRFEAYNLNRLAVVPSAGGESRILTESLDRAVSGPLLWSPDGKSLTFLVEDDRAVYVGRVPVAGGPVERLTTGRRTVSDISLGPDGAIMLLAGTATEVDEVNALEGGQLRRLTHQNDALFAGLELATTEDFTSKSKDGTVVNGLIVKPASYAPGKLYPTLLRIHGGPNGQDDWSFSFEREFFAANGYVVLAVNYRGSSGRGSAFQKAIYADWGHKEVIDLIGAVDRAVAMKIADPARLGIGGWSYGGILTDYTIATDTRFKAATSGAGSALQLSMYGSDQYIRQYEQEIGVPWKATDAWIRISYPFFKADRIKTPTLFLGGDKDFNVPIVGGEQMYQALKSLGVETQFVVYPDQFHGLRTPSYVRDRYERYLAWYDRFLKPAK
jgi:dipeptidyl aminopeptidase/acylaminoacyl peptidase